VERKARVIHCLDKELTPHKNKQETMPWRLIHFNLLSYVVLRKCLRLMNTCLLKTGPLLLSATVIK